MSKRMSIFIVVLLLAFVIVLIRPLLVENKLPAQSTGLYGGIFDDVGSGAQVTPGVPIIFPHDHLSHNNFAVEWWYLTANLFDAKGNQYPLQWTLFRFTDFRPVARWSDGQQFMGHAKISNATSTWFEERFARGGVGNAKVNLSSSGHFSAFIDDWHWASKTADLFPSNLKFTVNNEVEANLQLNVTMPYVLHGDKGYSAKFSDDSHASMYYSQPFITVAGVLKLPTGEVNVSGKGWFDHEWSARLSDQNTLGWGWDWFSLHLNNGDKLMLYNVHHRELEDSWFGSLITSQGEKKHLNHADIIATPTGYSNFGDKQLPLNWQLTLPKHGIDLNISMFKQEQWNRGRFSYYEGAVNVDGSHSGVGFIELTGY